MRGWGPPVGACACWHLRHAGGPCTFQNCGCQRSRWSWSLIDVVRVPLRLVRGW